MGLVQMARQWKNPIAVGAAGLRIATKIAIMAQAMTRTVSVSLEAWFRIAASPIRREPKGALVPSPFRTVGGVAPRDRDLRHTPAKKKGARDRRKPLAAAACRKCMRADAR